MPIFCRTSFPACSVRKLENLHHKRPLGEVTFEDVHLQEYLLLKVQKHLLRTNLI